MRRALSLLVLTTTLWALALDRGTGAPPVEADPNKEYRVFPGVGTWMVLVTTYSGPDAEALARQMTYKIRAEHNYPAYVFIYVDEESKRKQDELKRANEYAQRLVNDAAQDPGAMPVRGMRPKKIHLEEHWGVLIGGWNDIETATAAQKAIRTIMNVPELHAPSGTIPYETIMVVLRDKQGKPIMEGNDFKYECQRINPFSTAMVTRNPTLPSQRAAKLADPALKKFNENEEYSLLKCPKPYTLMVKEYCGAAEIGNTADGRETGFWSKLGIGGHKEGEALNAAGARAHVLASYLRDMKFEAYVLHGRTSSAVTIGGFDSASDPGMERVSKQLAQIRQTLLERMKSDPLQLFATPLPVEVPRP